jgi:hypothetical protein
MPRPRENQPPVVVVRTFTRDEIDRGIAKLRRRIDEVRGLNPRETSYDDARVDTVEANIREVIRDVFGPQSPEFNDHQHHCIWRGGHNLGDEEHECQAKFAAGIPQTVAMLEGLIARLEEKRDEAPAEGALASPARPEASGVRTAANLVISWSKAQSRTVASALRDWLPTVVPGLEPWMSEKDIAKGREWFTELQGVLAQARFCIICVTRENVRSPWIYYEVGAIAAKGPHVLICPYLIGVSPHMLADGPLGKWQCTVANEADTLALIRSLNSNALSSRHDSSLLEGNFSARWPVLAEQIGKVLVADVSAEEEFIASDADELAGVKLSSEARTMIIEVSKDPDGMLLHVRSSSGTCFQAHAENLCRDQSARAVARWEAALRELVAHGLLEPRAREAFVLTAKGFQVADILQAEGKGTGEDMA